MTNPTDGELPERPVWTVRRLIRAVAVAVAVVVLAILLFPPSADARVMPVAASTGAALLPLVALAALAVIVVTGVVVLLIRRRY